MASKTKLSAPTASYLLALRSELETAFRDDDDAIRLIRSVRAMSKAVTLDDKLRLTDVEVRDALINDEIRGVVASLTLNPLKVRVTPRPKSGDSGDANATLREDWTEAVVEDACTRGGDGHDARADVIDAACGDGGGWLRVVFKADTWNDRWRVSADLEAKEYDKKTEEAKREAGQPFLIECPDVLTLYPVWSAGQLTEVLVVTIRKRNSALRQYRLGLDDAGRLVPEELGVPVNTTDRTGTPSEVTVLEHWDGQWMTTLVEVASSGGSQQDPNINMVKQVEHKYGRVPFFYAPGLTFNWSRGHKVGWSIAESKRYLCEFRSYLLTLAANVAQRDAYKPVIVERTRPANSTQGDDRKPETTEYWEPRQLIFAEEGEKYSVLDFGGQSESLEHMIGYVDTMIEKLSTPKVSGDIGGSDPGSGFAVSQILAETRIREDPITQHVQAMWADVVRFIWKLGRDKIKEPIPVRSAKGKDGFLTVDPEKDLTEGVGLEIIIDPERATAKLIEERYFHERIEKRTIGRHMAIKEMGSNPDEVDDDIELDRIRASDQYIKRKDLLLYQELDRGDILEQAAAAIVQSGQLPGMGTTSGVSSVGNAVVPDFGALAATGGQGAPGAQMAPGVQGATGPMPQPGPGPQPVAAGSLGAAGPQPSGAPGAQVGGSGA